MQTSKPDSDLKADVLAELKWDTRVDDTEVGVQVHHGVVTLTGTVKTWAKRLAARAAARRVIGVRDIADDLKVEPYAPTRPNDTAIAEAARAALKWHPHVPDERIHTIVSNGAITLSGEVDCASQADEAAHAVGHLEGVRLVNNDLKIVAPSVAPAQLRSAIEGALDRHASREAKRIKLDIEGGRVTVSGGVDSIAERIAVVGAIAGTRGVQIVVDHTQLS